MRSHNVLRTSPSAFALAAILASSVSITADAIARDGHGPGGRGGPHFGGGRHFGGGPHFGPGHFGPGPGRFGGGRRFWHGRYWPYGVGPCWAWSPVYGQYVWQCF
jgi:hypothetical protein